MTLKIIGHNFAYEMECVVRIFFPGIRIDIVADSEITACSDMILTMAAPLDGSKIKLNVTVSIGGFNKHSAQLIESGELCERTLAAMLFELLCEKTGKRPVWGILTGIRPVRLCGQWREHGLDDTRILERLTGDYLVSPQKAALCLETGRAQEKILALNKPDTFSLYVGIPFCPTRCSYCSFVSHDIAKSAKLVPDYLRLLCEEIAVTAKIAKDLGLKLLTIYIGGGTPTTLSGEQLRLLLSAITSSFNLTNLLEFTVEAGRPDTITEEKLIVLREFGVGRVSVNPQTMNDAVLAAIGRAHSAEQIAESLELVKRIGFTTVNMDLITGLPRDNPKSFAETIEKVISFTPENITIHALAVKRSSNLRADSDAFATTTNAPEMQLYAEEKLKAAGYFPYYLYRQKPAADNLENTGFSKPGHEGIYNILSMEDNHHILAAGAGGVSKLLTAGAGGMNRIRRIFNHKYPYEYINRFDELMKRKTEELYARNS